MKVFITGGTGFIGIHVVRKLQTTGHNVLVLLQDRSEASHINMDYVIGDISDINGWKDEVKKFRPDAAIHMAWEGIPDYSVKISKKNLFSSINLISYLEDIGCKKIIGTGSCWEYGNFSGRLKEDDQIKPFSAFSTAKNAINWFGMEIAREKNITFIWTRLFYVYGPGQRKETLIPYLISCARKGIEPRLKTPFAKNDFIYVEDVADAVCQILNKGDRSQIYNVGSGYSTGVQEVTQILFREFDKVYEPKSVPADYAEPIINFWADTTKIKKETGWKPKHNFLDGIKETIEYFTKYKEEDE